MDSATCPNPSGAAASLFMAGISALSLLRCEIGDPSIYPEDTDPMSEYDFIVIGSGAAGSVVTNRLSRHRNWKILLVEAGGDPPYTSEIPALYPALQNTPDDWNFESDGKGDYCRGMVDNKCQLSRGKVLGGSSTLNTITYFRGHPHDYENWVKEAGKDWCYESLVPYFERAEGIDSRADSSHHHRAHLSLQPYGMDDLPMLKPLKRAAEKIGREATLDAHKLVKRGYFNTYGLLEDGVKATTAKIYLAPLKNMTNVHVTKNTTVTKLILWKKKRVVGVKLVKNGVTKTVTARKEVILSAGAFNSPKILMLSGIGPKNHLRDLGIEVAADLPVGKNLQDHLLLPAVVANINRGHDNPRRSLKRLIRSVTDYLLYRDGPLSGIGYRQFTGFFDSRHSKDSFCPNVQIQFEFVRRSDIEAKEARLEATNYNETVTAEFLRLANKSDTLFVIPTIEHPKSRGRVRLASTNPNDPPKINMNYLSEPEDEEAMLAGIAESMRILGAAPLNKEFKVEPRVLLRDCLRERDGRDNRKRRHIDESHLMTKDYWRCAMRTVATSDNHPVGTCRMGRDHKDSVVDPHLKVHWVKGLRVVDASVMPTITSGAITGPEIAIAEKAAEMICDEHSERDH